MNFLCDRGLLLNACGAAGKFVPQKTAISSLEGFLLEIKNGENGGTARVIGFDAEAGIEIKLPCTVINEGSLILNAKVFTEIVRSIDEPLISIIETDGMLVTVSGGSTNFTIKGMEAKLFPALPAVMSDKNIVFKRSVLKKMLRQTLYAVAQNDPVPTLTGAFFEFDNGEVSITCTNRMKLARRVEKYLFEGDPFSFIVPGRILGELEKILEDDDGEITVGISSKHIVFETENLRVISRLLDGQFMSYKNFIPKEFKTVITINPAEFRRLVEKASVIITDNGKLKTPLKLSVEDTKIIISCKNEQGQSFIDEMKVNKEGINLEIGFNNRLLLETISACEDETVTLNFNSSLSSACILPINSSENYVFLISPMRLNGN